MEFHRTTGWRDGEVGWRALFLLGEVGVQASNKRSGTSLTVDETFGSRLEDLRRRLRQLEAGIRTLQARLAAWDRDERRSVEPAREHVASSIAVAVEP